MPKNYFRAGGRYIVADDFLGKGWYVSGRDLCLNEIDFNNRKAKAISFLGRDNDLNVPLYFNLNKIEDNLYISPWSINEIKKYNITTNKFKEIPIEDRSLMEDFNLPESTINFLSVETIENEVFFLGYKYPAIVIINSKDDSVTYVDDWKEEINNLTNKGTDAGYFSRGYVIKNNEAMFPCACCSALVALDVVTKKSRIIKLDTVTEGFTGISKVADDLAVLTCRGNNSDRIIVFDISKEVVKREIVIPNCSKESVVPVHEPIVCDGRVFVFPIDLWYEKPVPISEIDLDSGEVIPVSHFSDLELMINYRKVYESVATLSVHVFQNRKILFATGVDMKWHEYDVVNDTVDEYYICFENDDTKIIKGLSYIEKQQLKGNSIIEEKDLPLQLFIGMLELE